MIIQEVMVIIVILCQVVLAQMVLGLQAVEELEILAPQVLGLHSVSSRLITL